MSAEFPLQRQQKRAEAWPSPDQGLYGLPEILCALRERFQAAGLPTPAMTVPGYSIPDSAAWGQYVALMRALARLAFESWSGLLDQIVAAIITVAPHYCHPDCSPVTVTEMAALGLRPGLTIGDIRVLADCLRLLQYVKKPLRQISEDYLVSPSTPCGNRIGAFLLPRWAPGPVAGYEIVDSSYFDTITVPSGSPDLRKFDYALLKYSWTDANGEDLDTRTAFHATGDSAVDDMWVGWNCLNNVIDGPSHEVLTWGGDNTTPSGFESVLIDLKRFADDHPSLTQIKVMMRAYWFYSRLDGNLTIQFQTYLGGVMVPYTTSTGQISWNNVGGVLVDDITRPRNAVTLAQTGSGPGGSPAGDEMGEIIYTAATQTAIIKDVTLPYIP